ncbi:unnamed protein product, partial [Adineta ricciae]
MQNNLEVNTLHRKKNHFYAITIILLLILVILLLILYVIEISRTKDNTNDLCLTPYCIKAANYLLESIDETIDPCENFYEFACGKWIKNAIIPPESGEERSISQIVKQLQHSLINLLASNGTEKSKAIMNAHRLYNSCIDEDAIEKEGIDAILSLVNQELGGWPVLQGSTWNESKYDFDRLILKLSEYNNYILFTVKTDVDETNSFIRNIH